MNNPLRIFIPALGAAAVATVVGVGVVMAQTGDDPPWTTPTADSSDPLGRADHMNDYLDQLAANLGVSRDALDGALKQTALDMLDQAVADGVIDEEKAAGIREMIEAGEGPMGIGPVGIGPMGGGFKGGHGPRGGGFPGGHFHDQGDGAEDNSSSDATGASIVS